MKTYSIAKTEIQDHLETLGWTLARGLLTPHATSPNGNVRLYFKPQGIHFSKSRMGSHKLGNAHSLFCDIRKMTMDEFMACVDRFTA